MVGTDSGGSFGGVNCGQGSTIIIVNPLDLLQEKIQLDIYTENKGATHRSKRVCLGWDRLSNSAILMHVHIWILRGLQILLCMSQSDPFHIDDHHLQVVGEDGSMSHCNWTRRCIVGTAFHLEFPLVEGRPDGRLPGSHQPHEGSKVQYTW